MQETKPQRLSFLARFCTLFAGLTLGGAVVAAAPTAPLDPTPHVALKTSMGEIVLELDQQKAPKSVANFLQYVNSGYYKGTVFHRVIDGFMIQGGGFVVRRLLPSAVKQAVGPFIFFDHSAPLTWRPMPTTTCVPIRISAWPP